MIMSFIFYYHVAKISLEALEEVGWKGRNQYVGGESC